MPSNLKNQVLGGLSDSILGSLTQTAVKPGGVDLVKNLLTGKGGAKQVCGLLGAATGILGGLLKKR